MFLYYIISLCHCTVLEGAVLILWRGAALLVIDSTVCLISWVIIVLYTLKIGFRKPRLISKFIKILEFQTKQFFLLVTLVFLLVT